MRHYSAKFSVFTNPLRRGFTLIEIIIVMVVILLMLGMALPAFHAITGNQSEAGAINIIAATLSRARTDALAGQRSVGVAFFYNATNQQSYMAEVEFEQADVYPSNSSTGSPPIYAYWALQQTLSPKEPNFYGFFFGTPKNSLYQIMYGPPIDVRANTDIIPLPKGIGVQTICNCNYNGNQRISDGYLSLGVIMFDSSGRIAALPYGLSHFSLLSQSVTSPTAPTATSPPGLNYPSTFVGSMKVGTNTITQPGVYSQSGLVIYQLNSFESVRSQSIDALYIDATPSSASTPLPDYTVGSPSQKQEEDWLDQNATPLPINRYTGKLVRAE